MSIETYIQSKIFLSIFCNTMYRINLNMAVSTKRPRTIWYSCYSNNSRAMCRRGYTIVLLYHEKYMLYGLCTDILTLYILSHTKRKKAIQIAKRHFFILSALLKPFQITIQRRILTDIYIYIYTTSMIKIWIYNNTSFIEGLQSINYMSPNLSVL